MCCALLGVSVSWFYKWWPRARAGGPTTKRAKRRAEVDAAVKTAFDAARGLHGSPRLTADLRDAGWEISAKTVADSMRRQQLVARRIRRRNGLTRQDRTAPKFPDLLKRDFTAPAPNCRWVGDMTEIPTDHGKLYLATVIDLYSRRLLGAATGLHPDAQLACDAIKMAVTVRGGKRVIWRDDESQRVIFHSDRGSTYTAKSFMKPVPQARHPPVDGPGRVLLRQRRRRGLLQQPGMGSPVPQPLRRHRHRPSRRARMVLGLLQPHPPAQQRWHDGPHHLRDHRPQPRSGLKRNPPRFGVNLTRSCRPRWPGSSPCWP